MTDTRTINRRGIPDTTKNPPPKSDNKGGEVIVMKGREKEETPKRIEGINQDWMNVFGPVA